MAKTKQNPSLDERSGSDTYCSHATAWVDAPLNTDGGSPGIKGTQAGGNPERKYVKGSATHRRHADDYIAATLEVVTIEEWKSIVEATIAAAKDGDKSARAWLSDYVLGKPESKAPSTLDVMARRYAGKDLLVEKIAHPHWEQQEFPFIEIEEASKRKFREQVRSELAELAVSSVSNP